MLVAIFNIVNFIFKEIIVKNMTARLKNFTNLGNFLGTLAFCFSFLNLHANF